MKLYLPGNMSSISYDGVSYDADDTRAVDVPEQAGAVLIEAFGLLTEPEATETVKGKKAAAAAIAT